MSVKFGLNEKNFFIFFIKNVINERYKCKNMGKNIKIK